jgi:hypothetical protein
MLSGAKHLEGDGILDLCLRLMLIGADKTDLALSGVSEKFES